MSLLPSSRNTLDRVLFIEEDEHCLLRVDSHPLRPRGHEELLIKKPRRYQVERLANVGKHQFSGEMIPI
ncbi:MULTISPECIES: hypothetical protein [Pseudomonas]|uniref:hypothetical protein n=1 Tax=Pseudomonas TaxID=286 RepID=UPI00117A3E34|nr:MULTISPECIES: hypothetical protein [Pseudomonas]